jgi:hypothetical protein
VNVWLTLMVTLAAVAVAICLLVGLRRYAPPGGYFSDREPPAAVYTVIGTAFAVILGFVIFLAFESYTAAKSSAVQEAVAVSEMYRHAASFPSTDRRTSPWRASLLRPRRHFSRVASHAKP